MTILYRRRDSGKFAKTLRIPYQALYEKVPRASISLFRISVNSNKGEKKMKKGIMKLVLTACLATSVLFASNVPEVHAAGTSCYAVYRTGNHCMDKCGRYLGVHAYQTPAQGSNFNHFDYYDEWVATCCQCGCQDGSIIQKWLYGRNINLF